MNDKASPNTQPLGPDTWEATVQAAARAFPYPPTPDLAGGVRARLAGEGTPSPRPGSAHGRLRTLAWVLAALVLLLAGLFAVPGVRATIVEVLQIGGIRIFVVPPTPSPIPPPAATPAAGARAAPSGTPTAPPPTATPLASLLDLAGETTLAAAQRAAGFTIRLPAYPSDLGPPAHVFLQRLSGPLVVLVWTQPGRARLSLHEFGPDTYADKFPPTVVQETTVNGAPAVWTEGPHVFVFRSGDAGLRELVHGHTLVWQQGGVTYRLETDQDLAEAVRMAGSVR